MHADNPGFQGNGHRQVGTALLLALALAAAPPGQAETRKVIAGPEYERSGFYKLWFGEDEDTLRFYFGSGFAF